jgi:hypothetical protein
VCNFEKFGFQSEHQCGSGKALGYGGDFPWKETTTKEFTQHKPYGMTAKVKNNIFRWKNES